jgi:ABC-type transport system involved in multi-copper enzyme maturation permease subunit
MGVIGAVLITVLFGWLYTSGINTTCSGPNTVCDKPTEGPNGEAVNDRFYFIHKPLNGNGSITVRITSMTGQIAHPPALVPGLTEWAKTGAIIKESTKPGAPYAAIALTGSHGVHMQYDYTGDIAGRPGTASKDAPRWLKLTRSGNTITGYESTDGKTWVRTGEVTLSNLASDVQIGIFATSPCDLTVGEAACRFTEATATMDSIDFQGVASSTAWSIDDVGGAKSKEADGSIHHPGRHQQLSDTSFKITGTGDMAPLGTAFGQPIEVSLFGAIIGFFVTAFIGAAFAATRLQGKRLTSAGLIAKALVLGAITFTAGAIAAGVALPLCKQAMQAKGNYILPTSQLTEWRIILGTAALFALVSLIALALASLTRRKYVAILAISVLVIVPYILAVAGALPTGVMDWLLRLTPAAGFAIVQSIPAYPQVTGLYTAQAGYYPLAPWIGLSVACVYALVFLGIAFFTLRKNDSQADRS